VTVVNWYALLGSSLLYIVGLPVCKRSQTFAFFLWLFVEVVTCASSVLTCVEEYPLVVCLSVCCLHSFLFDSSSYKVFCRFLNANTLSSWYLLCGKKDYSLLYCMAMWALHPRISVTRLASVTYSLLCNAGLLTQSYVCRLFGCFACNFVVYGIFLIVWQALLLFVVCTSCTFCNGPLHIRMRSLLISCMALVV
jgi:hypothetical protein